jgi:uncharacterized protein YjbI with pentapeptide repeats
MVVLAIAFGWHRCTEDAKRTVARLERRIKYLETEADWAKSRAEVRERRGQAPTVGHSLRGQTIQNTTQGVAFNKCDMSEAKLIGSFQGAVFDDSKLADTTLTGGVSDFQLASFIGADLTGAVLTGGGSSFQAATFERAKLNGARINCSGASFQAVNIDGAEFKDADLSALEGESLKSCHFNEPPIYSEKTKFPSGFDPVDQGWKLVR